MEYEAFVFMDKYHRQRFDLLLRNQYRNIILVFS